MYLSLFPPIPSLSLSLASSISPWNIWHLFLQCMFKMRLNETLLSLYAADLRLLEIRIFFCKNKILIQNVPKTPNLSFDPRKQQHLFIYANKLNIYHSAEVFSCSLLIKRVVYILRKINLPFAINQRITEYSAKFLLLKNMKKTNKMESMK